MTQLDIRRMPVSALLPADYNPRKDLSPADREYQSLERSIREFGLLEPVVWNEQTGRIVGGHQRLKVLLAQGETETDVVVVCMDENTERAANIALNKISGDWDFAKLADILLELDHANFDLDLTGFYADEIAQIMAWTPGEPTEGEPIDREDGFNAGAAARELKDTITHPGDIWILGRNRLICGDSQNPADIDALLQEELPGVVWADPPYGLQGLRGGNSKPFGGGDRVIEASKGPLMIGDASTETAVEAFRLIYSMFPDAVQVWWGANHYASALPDSRGWIVWDKLTTGEFADAELAWTNADRTIKVCRHQWNGVIRASERGERRLHPTQKPIALPVWFLELSGAAGPMLDPFAGSGSALIACEQLGRSWYGLELSPACCDVIVRRWEEFTGEKAETAPER